MAIGPLEEPKDIKIVKSEELLLSWTPPPTLDNTDILGYNVTINNTAYSFTFDPETRIYYSDFSPCDCLIITISGYNRVDGEPAKLLTQYVPSSEIC